MKQESTAGGIGCLFFIVIVVGGLLYAIVREDTKLVEKTQRTIVEFGIGKVVHIYIDYENKSDITKAILENSEGKRVQVYIRDKIPLIGERWTITSERMRIGAFTLGSKMRIN